MYWEGRAIILTQRRRLKTGGRIVLIGVSLGLLYPILAREIADPLALVNGAIIGFCAGLIVAVHQDRNTHIRSRLDLPFTLHVLLVAVGYMIGFAILIISVVTLTRSAESGMSVTDYVMTGPLYDFVMKGDFKLILIWALFFSLFISFNFSISKKVAGGLLLNTILGKYSKPRDEHRVFMFIDLNNATSYAENLGEDRYYRLLNDLFADITPAIMLSGAEIYRYVGDQLAVSWLVTKNFDLTWCVRAYFMSRELLFERAEHYLTEYDLVPTFKASMHDGMVITAEVGEIKSQIMFHGDAVYVTEQIEKECRRLERPFLISGDLIHKITLPGIYQKKRVDTINVKSVGQEIELYTVETVVPGQ